MFPDYKVRIMDLCVFSLCFHGQDVELIVGYILVLSPPLKYNQYKVTVKK